jgi:hypothetical protein
MPPIRTWLILGFAISLVGGCIGLLFFADNANRGANGETETKRFCDEADVYLKQLAVLKNNRTSQLSISPSIINHDAATSSEDTIKAVPNTSNFVPAPSRAYIPIQPVGYLLNIASAEYGAIKVADFSASPTDKSIHFDDLIPTSLYQRARNLEISYSRLSLENQVVARAVLQEKANKSGFNCDWESNKGDIPTFHLPSIFSTIWWMVAGFLIGNFLSWVALAFCYLGWWFLIERIRDLTGAIRSTGAK